MELLKHGALGGVRFIIMRFPGFGFEFVSGAGGLASLFFPSHSYHPEYCAAFPEGVPTIVEISAPRAGLKNTETNVTLIGFFPEDGRVAVWHSKSHFPKQTNPVCFLISIG